jgi:hypothetical protein
MVSFNAFIPCRWYPVTSRSVQPVIFADLHVVLKFEPVDGRYRKFQIGNSRVGGTRVNLSSTHCIKSIMVYNLAAYCMLC